MGFGEGAFIISYDVSAKQNKTKKLFPKKTKTENEKRYCIVQRINFSFTPISSRASPWRVVCSREGRVKRFPFSSEKPPKEVCNFEHVFGNVNRSWKVVFPPFFFLHWGARFVFLTGLKRSTMFVCVCVAETTVIWLMCNLGVNFCSSFSRFFFIASVLWN